MNKELKLIKTN